ncbi:spore germination protein [Halalkalibacter akibai]|nr:spore germination protein [Halalkalibacter akibai]
MNNQKYMYDEVLKKLTNCDDLVKRSFPELDINILYIGHLVGTEELDQDVLTPIAQIKKDEVIHLLGRSQYQSCDDSSKVIKGILAGKAAIFHKKNQSYLIDIYVPKTRAVTAAEIETSIVGPREAFVESIEINLSCIRRRIQSEKLKVVDLQVGSLTNTKINLVYIEGLAPRDVIKQVGEKIKHLKITGVQDIHMLLEHIDDNPYSLFPQLLTTERPDVAASKLLEGKVIGLFDGSPYAFTAPTTFWEFFQSPDDYNRGWVFGTFSRVLRFIALIIMTNLTALYVALVSFHYEMIPVDLLKSLLESRSKVPFPPIYEAIIIEFIVELLREAGARLPTKIGQTIGIVGGIVIGTASVQAGFTSNILIVIVAISAMASYVIPHVIMSASLRMARFGLILLAGLLGNFGLITGLIIFLIHLSRRTSFDTSFVIPKAPFSDWRDTFIRVPLRALNNKPSQTNDK